MKTKVRTSLTLGRTKEIKFDKYSVEMYDNKHFEKSYNNYDEFLKEFCPNIPSEKLLNRIKAEFKKENGKITYKPKGYKANQTFYFCN